jgi:hypothetical protein
MITTRAAATMAMITVRLAPALASLFSPEGAVVEDVTTSVDVVTESRVDTPAGTQTSR